MTSASLHTVFNEAGLRATAVYPLPGGSMDRAFHVCTGSGDFFLKCHPVHPYPDMLFQEAAALAVLQKNTPLQVPEVLRQGTVAGWQYLLLPWVAPGRSGAAFWDELGVGLAALHRCSFPDFGWETDNYIGLLPQCNTRHPQWPSFYAECRLLPLVQQLVNQGVFSAAMLAHGERLCLRLPDLFPADPPALLHGDCWRGNFLVNAQGAPVLIDPSVYVGHREMDLGMSLLFGGFDQRFYAAYEAAWPLAPGWRERVPLTQLYPLLVHAVLFGGHYAGECAAILQRFS